MRLTSPIPSHRSGSGSDGSGDRTAVVSVDSLRELALFAGLPEGELEQLASVLELSTVRPGTILETQDVPVRVWRMLASGHAVVERDATPIGLLGAGDSWCEHSILNGVRSSISVVALSPVTLLSARQEQFFALPDDHPLLAGRLVARSATSADRLALPVLNALIHMAQRSA
jgi:CRP-like cAMP-binding protein